MWGVGGMVEETEDVGGADACCGIEGETAANA